MHTGTPTISFDEVMPPRQILFTLRGRMSRRLYWRWGIGALLLGSLLAQTLLEIARLPDEQVDTIISLLLLWPGIATAVKRCHDCNRSGWRVVLYLVAYQLLPIAGLAWMTWELALSPGSHGMNRWGEDLSTDKRSPTNPRPDTPPLV